MVDTKMTIRFTHTEKWEDAWFRRLTPAAKLLFLYIIDRCDIAGIWEKDLELAGFITGLDKNGDTESAYKEIYTRIIHLDETHDMVKNFIKRQRNLPLNPENATHVGIINRLLPFKGVLFVDELLNTPEVIGATKGLSSSICISKGKGNSKCKSNIKFSFENKSFEGISSDDISRWSEAYPAVDIIGDIKRAAEWLISNPQKRKSNYNKYLTNWFNRTQDKGGSNSGRQNNGGKSYGQKPAGQSRRNLADTPDSKYGEEIKTD